MKISREDVQHVGYLARLRLGEREIEMFTTQLNAILEYAALLEELDTDGVPPTAHVLELRNVVRADEARPSTPRESVLANAPESETGCFKVPPVIE